MIDTQKKFAEVVGETHTKIRNVLGRGRGPRQFDADILATMPELAEQGHFAVVDALAWRIVRKLTHLGMTWDEAAKIVKRERPADDALRHGIGQADFFAVWEFYGPPRHEPGSWRGKPSDFAEVIEGDIVRYGQVASVRMVSLQTAYREAELVAEQAGFAFKGGEIVRLDEAEA